MIRLLGWLSTATVIGGVLAFSDLTRADDASCKGTVLNAKAFCEQLIRTQARIRTYGGDEMDVRNAGKHTFPAIYGLQLNGKEKIVAEGLIAKPKCSPISRRARWVTAEVMPDVP